MKKLDEAVITQIIDYDPAKWLADHDPEEAKRYESAFAELIELKGVMETAGIDKAEYRAAFNRWTAAAARYNGAINAANAGFAWEFKEDCEPELIEAYKRKAKSLIVSYREEYLAIAHADGVTAEEAKTFTTRPYYQTYGDPDTPQSDTLAAFEYGNKFSDDALRDRLGSELKAIEQALSEADREVRTLLLDPILDDLIAHKWDVNAKPCVLPKRAPVRVPFLMLPHLALPNKLARTMFGSGVSGRRAQNALIDGGIVQLREYSHGPEVLTVLTLLQESKEVRIAEALTPLDRYRHDRLCAVFAEYARATKGPVRVPIEYVARAIWGDGVRWTEERRLELENEILPRLRVQTEVNWDQIARARGVNLRDLAAPFGLTELEEKGPLVSTRITRGVEDGRRYVAFDSVPILLAYGMISGRMTRLPAELIALDSGDTARVRMTDQKQTLETYLMDRIVTMYRDPTQERRITTEAIYEVLEVETYKAKQMARRDTEDILTQWSTLRDVRGRQRSFIKAFAPVTRGRAVYAYDISVHPEGLAWVKGGAESARNKERR